MVNGKKKKVWIPREARAGEEKGFPQTYPSMKIRIKNKERKESGGEGGWRIPKSSDLKKKMDHICADGSWNQKKKAWRKEIRGAREKTENSQPLDLQRNVLAPSTLGEENCGGEGGGGKGGKRVTGKRKVTERE